MRILFSGMYISLNREKVVKLNICIIIIKCFNFIFLADTRVAKEDAKKAKADSKGRLLLLDKTKFEKMIVPELLSEYQQLKQLFPVYDYQS
jgi:hypothetical protein